MSVEINTSYILICATPLQPVIADHLHSWTGGTTPLPWPFLTSGLLPGSVAVYDYFSMDQHGHTVTLAFPYTSITGRRVAVLTI